jgi:hypothetical protein
MKPLFELLDEDDQDILRIELDLLMLQVKRIMESTDENRIQRNNN